MDYAVPIACIALYAVLTIAENWLREHGYR